MQTILSDTLKNPDGTPFTGTLSLRRNTLKPNAQSSQADALSADLRTVEVADGVISIAFASIDSEPQYYSVSLTPHNGPSHTEIWTISRSSSPLQLSDVRKLSPPDPLISVPVSEIELGTGNLIYGGANGLGQQLSPGSNGQFLSLNSGLPLWANAVPSSTCVVTNGAYADPAWITSIDRTKIVGGFVTEVLGTINQISATPTTGQITLSIPVNPVLPGTTAGAFSGPLTVPALPDAIKTQPTAAGGKYKWQTLNVDYFGIVDSQLQFGYNMDSLAGNEVPTEPAFWMGFENKYFDGVRNNVEMYWQYQGPAASGFTRRPIFIQINRDTHAISAFKFASDGLQLTDWANDADWGNITPTVLSISGTPGQTVDTTITANAQNGRAGALSLAGNFNIRRIAPNDWAFDIGGTNALIEARAGQVSIGGNLEYLASLTVKVLDSRKTIQPSLATKGVAGQTTPVLVSYTSASLMALQATENGNVVAGHANDAGYRLYVNGSGANGTAAFVNPTAGGSTSIEIGWDGSNRSATTTRLRVRAGTTQNTTNLTEWTNPTGTPLTVVSASGRVGVLTNNPTTAIDVISESNNDTDGLRIRSNNLSQSVQLGWAGLAGSGQFTIASGASALVFKTNGVERMRLDTGGALIFGLSTDLSISRSAPGVLAVGTGPAGNTDGSVRAANFIGTLTGNSATATMLQTPRNIAGSSFNGSQDISISSTGLSDASDLVRGASSVTATGTVPYTSGSGRLTTAPSTSIVLPAALVGIEGNTASHPAIKRQGDGIAIRNANDSSFTEIMALRTRHSGVQASQLPLSSAENAGSVQFVIDALTPVIGSPVTGGGAAPVLVWSTGSGWHIFAI